MQPQPARRFTLLDAMVLIAATAAGLVLEGALWPKDRAPASIRNFAELIGLVMFLSAPLAAMWTAATLVLQLRRPRHRLRRLTRRPGIAVCFAVSSALVLEAAPIGCAMQGKEHFFSTAGLIAVCGTPLMAGSAAAAAWVLSLLAWGYRPAADWLDRLGRLMGLYWMISLVAMGWVFANW